VRTVDGHDHRALLDAMGPSTTGAPVAVIADTVKGKGVSFMEDRVEWHHRVPDAAQVRAALAELTR
jgi:transketolase